jgi:hypothetical protein
MTSYSEATANLQGAPDASDLNNAVVELRLQEFEDEKGERAYRVRVEIAEWEMGMDTHQPFLAAMRMYSNL